jgi:hypothetical protein
MVLVADLGQIKSELRDSSSWILRIASPKSPAIESLRENIRRIAEVARLMVDAGLIVEVRVPPEIGTDWLDVLNQRERS